jgi:hypothetical protein
MEFGKRSDLRWRSADEEMADGFTLHPTIEGGDVNSKEPGSQSMEFAISTG